MCVFEQNILVSADLGWSMRSACALKNKRNVQEPNELYIVAVSIMGKFLPLTMQVTSSSLTRDSVLSV